jgi:hypothetical protein
VFSALNLPQAALKLGRKGNIPHVFDPIRRKWLLLTPEEWVRQHWISFLHRQKGYPISLMKAEGGFTWNRMAQRTDLICHDSQGKPLLLLECKAPGVKPAEAEFDQLLRYQRQVGAEVLVLSNGVKHFMAIAGMLFREVEAEEVKGFL